jgi:hypothetical protein
MRKNMISNLFLLLGLFFLILSYGYRFLITSDIPVNFSVSEALNLHLLIFISTFLFICGSVTITQKKISHILITILTLFFVINLFIFNTAKSAEYFSSSYAQLSIAFLLHPILIILFNIFLITKARNAIH